MKYYAGTGSRETPQDIQQLFEIVGEFLAKKYYVLRSGGAKGADKAFEKGCDKVNSNKEIYLPWERFENSTSTFIVNNSKAFEIAEEFHPYWHNLTQGARKLLSQYKQNNDWEWYVKEFQIEMQTRKDMIKAIDRLKEILDDEEDVYLICYEKDCTRCHRNLIAKRLQKEGYSCKELKI